MKANDPLAKLLRAAARAEREATPAPAEMPFGLATRLLAERRAAEDLFPLLPLFRWAVACSALIAITCAGLHLKRPEAPDVYESLNYSLVAAYMQ
jgi:hypothetical protein